MYKRQVIDKEEYDEDRLMETVMEAPIEDFVTEESVYEIYTAPDEDFRTTRDFLRDKDYTCLLYTSLCHGCLQVPGRCTMLSFS